MREYKAECLCKNITLQIEIKDIHVCYCNMCRKYSGAVCSIFTAVSKDKFRKSINLNTKTINTSLNAKRVFCSLCNSFIGMEYNHNEAYFNIGLLKRMPNQKSLKKPIYKHFLQNKKKSWIF